MTRRYLDGAVVSPHLPLRPRGELPPMGVHGPARGVVLRTYQADEKGLRQGLGVECDVLLYGGNGRVLARVPVKGGGGAHNLEIWTPAPTTKDLRTGRAVTFTTTTISDVLSSIDNPADLDGDHVLVEFLGGLATDPLITSPLPHPRAVARARSTPTTIEAGAAHPATPDAPTRYVRHQGTIAMVDRRGSVVIDTTGAPKTSSGDAAVGSEPAGNVVVQLRSAGRLEVRQGSAVLLVIEGGVLKLGDNATSHATVFEALKTAFDTHTHPQAGGGTTGVPSAPLSTSARSPVLLDAP